MRILAIETSCDETSMALVDIHESSITIHGHFTASQAEMHSQYGGVFPAMAKREHVKTCVPLLATLLSEATQSIPKEEWVLHSMTKEAEIKSMLDREEIMANELCELFPNQAFPKLDAIAVTNGPGLEPALWVGINFARALGLALSLPVIGTNHMLGHLYSGLLPIDTLHTEITLHPIPKQAVSLLVSGGHTELVALEDGNYTLLGATLDDAIGEAFDKVARMLDLTYPGGPLISKLAEEARDKDIPGIVFPRPMMHSKNYEFSYSGLKTAVMYHIQKNPITTDEQKMSIARGFEDAAIEVIIKKTKDALEEKNAHTLLLGGGVAANNHLKNELKKLGEEQNITVLYPLSSLTGDNALMIAIAAGIKYINREVVDESETLKANGMLKIA